MKKLFFTWQDSVSRKWFPIGQLTFSEGIYRFLYIEGAREAQLKAGFHPLVSFPNLEKVYESDKLFPMFANRVMPTNRPEYEEIVRFLSLPDDQYDPMAFLARTGGAKVTDTFEIFPSPRFENGKYHLRFFAHGLRHIPQCSIDRIEGMRPDDQLFLAHDFQNEYDSDALQLHTSDNYIVGYCPSYLLDDVNTIREEKEVHVSVERVNDVTSPLQFRLMCRLTYCLKEGHEPFATGNFRSITQTNSVVTNAREITFS